VVLIGKHLPEHPARFASAQLALSAWATQPLLTSRVRPATPIASSPALFPATSGLPKWHGPLLVGGNVQLLVVGR